MGAEQAYRDLAAAAGLSEARDFSPGPVTPLLTKGGSLRPAVGGPLAEEEDLEVPGQQRRRVKRRALISSFSAQLMEPGLVLPVYVNPQDPEDILVVW